MEVMVILLEPLTYHRAFLDRGYAVIFLYRDTSLRPFQRHLMGRDFLDSLSTDGTAVTGEFLHV